MSQGKRLVAGIVLAASMAATSVAFGGENPKDLMQALGIHAFPPQVIAPDFTLKALGGKEVSLKDFQGKVVLLNFWATWCLPCQWEMPHLEQLYQAYKDQGFVVLAVALDVEGARTVKPFVKAQKLTYPILLDPGLRVAERYRVLGPPLTFLIGPQGEAIGIAPGPREWAGEKAMALIRQLLDSSKAKQPR